MAAVEVREVRASKLSQDELQEIADFLTIGLRALDPLDQPLTAKAARNELHPGDEIVEKRRFTARIDDELVGLLGLELQHVGGNQHIVEASIYVHPERTRHGIGTAFVRKATQVAKETGRTSLIAWSRRSDDSDRFWDRLAMPEKLAEKMSRLIVADVDRDLMKEWRTTSAAETAGYELIRWRGACPEENISLLIAAEKGMDDAPLDDLEMDFPLVDEQWVRVREKSIAERDRQTMVIVAIDPEGKPAGMTEVILYAERPWYVMQQGTTTLAEHRNQGIGRWLKAEMFADIQANYPETRVIDTGNAGSNAPMLSINDQMGFGPYLELTIRQASIDEIEAALSKLDVA